MSLSLFAMVLIPKVLQYQYHAFKQSDFGRVSDYPTFFAKLSSLFPTKIAFPSCKISPIIVYLPYIFIDK